jgi:hypothetical protein
MKKTVHRDVAARKTPPVAAFKLYAFAPRAKPKWQPQKLTFVSGSGTPCGCHNLKNGLSTSAAKAGSKRDIAHDLCDYVWMGWPVSGADVSHI